MPPPRSDPSRAPPRPALPGRSGPARCRGRRPGPASATDPAGVRDPHRLKRARIGFPAAVLVLLLGGCGESPSSPSAAQVEFAAPRISLDDFGEAAISLSNRSARTVGPIHLRSGEVRAVGQGAIPGAEIGANPATIPTLPAGIAREVVLSLEPGTLLPVGAYTASLDALDGDGVLLATLGIEFNLVCASDRPRAHTLSLPNAPTSLRQGQVLALDVDARGPLGERLEEPCLTGVLEDPGSGIVDASGRVVAYTPGPFRMTLRSGSAEVILEAEVVPRGVAGGSLTVVGEGRWTRQHTSDLWLWGNVAYTGTWGARSTSEGLHFGNALHAWDISDPERPVRTHTVEVNARTVNDVKIRDDGTLAVMTHESSNDGRNGVTLLDLSDPLHPVPVTRFTDGLEAGIHNVWIEGDHVYLVVNGIGNGLRVLDVADPSRPRIVASYYGGASFLHDVYVRDGLAFLSHWDAGLIILDVGNGIAGGSPQNPVEVGRTLTTGGRTHNAWYWPETGYVFVGEENFTRPGKMHVIDARDLSAPREVATYEVPGHTPHNFWLDESRGVLYLAWYGRGLRVLDVSGELLGALDRQGREIAVSIYDDPAASASCNGPLNVTCTWAPQLHHGHVFVSDMNSGLRVLRPEF